MFRNVFLNLDIQNYMVGRFDLKSRMVDGLVFLLHRLNVFCSIIITSMIDNSRSVYSFVLLGDLYDPVGFEI